MCLNCISMHADCQYKDLRNVRLHFDSVWVAKARSAERDATSLTRFHTLDFWSSCQISRFRTCGACRASGAGKSLGRVREHLGAALS